MTSLLADKPGFVGAQEPRFASFPGGSSAAGEEAVELAAMAGLNLDPWQ